jgi:GT2 family glycosyltransferase
MIRTSVVIPTRNRPGPLAACLRALAVSFPANAETIVVSDGGAEDLGPVVAPFVDALRLRLLEVEHGGPGAARNRGLALAAGEIVAFTDDDCRPRPGWLDNLAAGVHLSPPRAAGGSTFNGLPDNAYAEAAQMVLFLLAQHDRDVAGKERMLPSNNFAFPTQALRSLGGFDERFRTAEDRDLCRRWANSGFELGRVPDAIVDHHDSLNLKSFLAKFFAYGRGAARFHGGAVNPSLRESLRFHFRLPALAAAELRQRSFTEAAPLVPLLILWELANLAGYAAERTGSR